MRPIFCFCALTIAVLCLDADNTFAQPTDALSRYQKGKMIEISDMLGGKEFEKCSVESKRYGGTVSLVQFSEGAKIDNFTLKTPKGSVKIYLPRELYTERISNQDGKALPTLIAKGRRLTVDTHRCGDSRKIIVAAYILAGIHMETLGYSAGKAQPFRSARSVDEPRRHPLFEIDRNGHRPAVGTQGRD